MSEHFNELTPAEAERLALLMEEMGEAIHMIGKIMRHGYQSTNPDETDAFKKTMTNRHWLTKEVADVQVAIQMMLAAKDMDAGYMGNFRLAKSKKLPIYLHHQEPS